MTFRAESGTCNIFIQRHRKKQTLHETVELEENQATFFNFAIWLKKKKAQNATEILAYTIIVHDG